MSLSSPSILQLSHADWRGPRTVQIAHPVASRECSRAGEFSCLVRCDDLYRLGFASDIRGLWFRWVHPRAGIWGGPVWGCPAQDGTVELTGRTFHALLSGRRVEPDWRFPLSTPGGLAKRLLWQAHTDAPLPFTSIVADEAGILTELQTRGEMVEALLERLAAAAGAWFDITVGTDGSIAWQWRSSWRDKTAKVLLSEGRELAAVRIEPTLEGIANDVLAVGSNLTWGLAYRAQAVDQDSRTARGRWQSTIEFPTVKNRAVLLASARKKVNQTAEPPLTGTFSLPEISPWVSEIRPGDTVGIRSVSQDMVVAFDVAVMAVDSTSGLVKYDGVCREVTQ